jgi:MSHA pilin protein MshC
MIELITVMIIVGIMAVVILPRFDLLGGFDAIGYADQIEAWLRFTQKSALDQRRMVSMDLSTSPPTLRQSTSTTCNTTGTPMSGLPGGWRTPASSTTIANSLGNTICFDSMGRPYATSLLVAQQSIQVKDSGTTIKTIYVEPETGYVH